MSDVSFITVMSQRGAKAAPSAAPPLPTPSGSLVRGGGWIDSTVGASIVAATISAGIVYSILTKISRQKSRRRSVSPQRRPQPASPTTASDEGSPTRTPTDESVARFCKMEELGRGAFGVVYKGRHYRTGELVAIKEMPSVGSEELKTEFELVVGLKHEHIVNVIAFEVGQRHARLYLEWVAGGSLADTIKRFPVDEELARSYVRQILLGLGFLHVHNVLHRDIKPKNILVDHRGILKLTDFGLSRHLDSIHDRTKAAGTPVYMAPECVRGQFSIGSDIWAVGATLSEMLLRQIPWSHIDPQILQNQMALLYHIASFQGHKGHHPIIPKSVSVECQNFMEVCFAADPKDRQTCELLLQHPWFAKAPPGGDSPRRRLATLDSDPNSPASSQRESTVTFSQVSAVSK